MTDRVQQAIEKAKYLDGLQYPRIVHQASLTLIEAVVRLDRAIDSAESGYGKGYDIADEMDAKDAALNAWVDAVLGQTS